MMKRFLPLRAAFGSDTVARDIADSCGGLSWSLQTVQMVLATLRRLHLSYHGPLLNLPPVGGPSSSRAALAAPKPRRSLTHK
jgi:hypothetical protein